MIPNNSQTNHNTAAPTSVGINENGELARFPYAPDDSIEIIMSLRMGEEVHFPYTAKDSDADCCVLRRPVIDQKTGEPLIDKKTGKKDKWMRPFVNGEIGKAELTFNPYRMEDFGLARGFAILIVEGEKCVEVARLFTIVATSFQSKGKKERQHGLELIKQAGIAQVWILPDNDSSGYKQANEIGELASKIGLDVIILDPLLVWDNMPLGGSIDDILEDENSPMKDNDKVVNKITQAAIEAKRRQLEESFQNEAINDFAENKSQNSVKSARKNKDGTDIPEPTAQELLETFREDYAYHNDQKTWRLWTDKIWKKLDSKHFEHIVYSTCQARGKKFNTAKSFISNIVYSLELNLLQSDWVTWDRKRYIPFSNGVLDLETRELLPHEKGHKFTSHLPREYHPINNYSDPLRLIANKAPNFASWLDTACEGDHKKMIKLLAVINGILKYRFADLQMFVHLVGRPGTGKGTFARLLQKIVGSQNTESSTLQSLSQSEYELAKIIDKQLVTLPDEDKQVGNFSRLKSLTGGDLISYRQIYGSPCSAHFHGTILAISNNPIFAGDTTGLDRRLCLIQFNNQIPKTRRNYRIEDAIASEINVITNAALLLTDTQVTESLRNLGEYEIREYEAANWEMQCNVNSIADFINNHLKFNSDNYLIVGNKDKEDTLYQRYFEFCKQSNLLPKSLNNFSHNLIEIANNLGYKLTKKKRNFGAIIQGIDWLGKNDQTIEQILESDGLSRHGDGLSDDLKTLTSKVGDGSDDPELKPKNEEKFPQNNKSPDKGLLGCKQEKKVSEPSRHGHHFPDAARDSAVTPAVTSDGSTRHLGNQGVEEKTDQEVEKNQTDQEENKICDKAPDDFPLGDSTSKMSQETPVIENEERKPEVGDRIELTCISDIYNRLGTVTEVEVLGNFVYIRASFDEDGIQAQYGSGHCVEKRGKISLRL